MTLILYLIEKTFMKTKNNFSNLWGRLCVLIIAMDFFLIGIIPAMPVYAVPEDLEGDSPAPIMGSSFGDTYPDGVTNSHSALSRLTITGSLPTYSAGIGGNIRLILEGNDHYLSGTNNFTGGLEVDGAVLWLEADDVLPKTNWVLFRGGGKLETQGHSFSISELQGTGTVNNSGGTVSMIYFNVLEDDETTYPSNVTFTDSEGFAFGKMGDGIMSFTGKTTAFERPFDFNGGTISVRGTSQMADTETYLVTGNARMLFYTSSSLTVGSRFEIDDGKKLIFDGTGTGTTLFNGSISGEGSLSASGITFEFDLTGLNDGDILNTIGGQLTLDSLLTSLLITADNLELLDGEYGLFSAGSLSGFTQSEYGAMLDFSLVEAGAPWFYAIRNNTLWVSRHQINSDPETPEPATWLLMLAGVVGVGVINRSRKHK
jgi:hypothetical protein